MNRLETPLVTYHRLLVLVLPFPIQNRRHSEERVPRPWQLRDALPFRSRFLRTGIPFLVAHVPTRQSAIDGVESPALECTDPRSATLQRDGRRQVGSSTCHPEYHRHCHCYCWDRVQR